MFDKNSYSNDKINLLLRKQKEEEYLLQLKTIDIISDLIPINNPVSKLKTYLIIYGFIFLILGLLTSFIIEKRKNNKLM